MLRVRSVVLVLTEESLIHMIAKMTTGMVARPAHWTMGAGSEATGLLRLIRVLNGPLAIASAMSPFTGGWTLPVGSSGS